MSTILDSLKKSSDKRDDHNNTSIDNFNFSDKKSASKSGFFMFLFLIIITAIILYFGYKYINSQPEGSLEIDTNNEITVNELSTPSVNNNVSESANLEKVQAKKIEKPNNESVKQQLVELKNKPKTAPQTKIITEPAINDTQNTELAATTKNKRIENNNNSQPIQQNQSQSKEPKSEKPMIELSLPKNQSAQNTEKKPTVPKQEYLYVYQLPFSVRKELPKFTLNIHIYDENPESRVAVINGTKFHVNDYIEEEILVKEIIRDGVLLEFNNQTFLIPNL
ncbi:MAG: general secretion pathway protein GspB [Marinicellaceae bacterium]